MFQDAIVGFLASVVQPLLAKFALVVPRHALGLTCMVVLGLIAETGVLLGILYLTRVVWDVVKMVGLAIVGTFRLLWQMIYAHAKLILILLFLGLWFWLGVFIGLYFFYEPVMSRVELLDSINSRILDLLSNIGSFVFQWASTPTITP
jgi:hypothetical protein